MVDRRESRRPRVMGDSMRRFLTTLVRAAILVTRKLQKMLFDLDERLAQGFVLARHQARVKRSTRVHDMMKEPDEQYYAEQYWRVIESNLDRLGCDKAGRYLDLGCGQGRLSIPLARWCSTAGGRVQGIDLSDTAVEQARLYAAQHGVTNATFSASDIGGFIADLDDACADGIVITEVLYMTPDAPDILGQARRVLKPGGVLVASFRSQYFYALAMVDEGNFEAIPMLLDQRSGRLMGGDVWFNWHRADEIRAWLNDELGFEIVDMFGVGSCSGIAGDPHAPIARPSALSPEDRATLMKLELDLARRVPDAGRYILVVARRRPEPGEPEASGSQI